MKKYYFKLSLSAVATIVFIFLASIVNGQNSSYNQNSIPIVGGQNCAFGANTLTNTGGIANHNVAVGHSALSISTGHSNTAVGHSALINSALFGNYNTAIGRNSLLSNGAGAFNTGLGALSDVGSNSLSNATAIGYASIVNNSNTIQLGNSAVTHTYIGVGTTATLVTGGLQVTGGSPGIGKVLTSDASGVATWQTPGGGTSDNGWLITGNSGTVDGFNFIGTTDNVPFNIRVNNIAAGRIDKNLKNAFYGTYAGRDNTSGVGNAAVGHGALLYNSEGNYNVAVGGSSLYYNTSGFANTSVGVSSMSFNVTGVLNTAL
jgi:hypothetical protein